MTETWAEQRATLERVARGELNVGWLERGDIRAALARIDEAAAPKWLTIKTPCRVEIETAPSRPWDPERDFDEVVLYLRGKGWLHVEMLGRDSAFVSIADRRFWLRLRGNKATITNEEPR